MKNLTLAGLLIAASVLPACAAVEPVDGAIRSEAVAGPPLDTLPANIELARIRHDLLATAADRYGQAALDEALSAPAHLIVKRFVGMAPPPPVGAAADWRPVPAAALLIRRESGWLIRDGSEWRPARADVAAEIDSILLAPEFWSKAAATPPCPDFGASLLMLKTGNKPETVRNSMCSSQASKIVEAALRA